MDVRETGHRHMDVSQTGGSEYAMWLSARQATAPPPATVLTLCRTSGYRQRVCLTLQPSTELPAPLYVCVILDVWLFVTAGRPAPPRLPPPCASAPPPLPSTLSCRNQGRGPIVANKWQGCVEMGFSGTCEARRCV
jgi:hypothetical protein